MRKRMRRYEIPGGARFVTFSCQRRLALFRNGSIANVMMGAIERARREHGFRLFAWVIMPEHVHLLVSPGDGVPLDRSLVWMKMSVSKRVLPRWRELRAPILARIATEGGGVRFWQKGGGFDRNVRDETEFTKTVRYIHRNPVERGLVERPEEWRWSSVRWWMGERDGEVECDEPPGDLVMWRGFV